MTELWHLVKKDGYPHELLHDQFHPGFRLCVKDDEKGIDFESCDGFDESDCCFFNFYDIEGDPYFQDPVKKEVVAWLNLKEADEQCKNLIRETAIADILNSWIRSDVCQNKKEE